MNKAMFSGNLVKDVVVRPVGEGQVAAFTVAVNRRFKSKKTGEFEERVAYCDCEVWGERANTVQKYFSKGKGIVITDSIIEQDTWEKDGVKRSKLKFRVNDWEFASGPKKSENANPAPAPGASESATPVSDEIPF